jgi:hypothetical protein
MEGIERAYLSATIRALLSANQNLGLLPCYKALQSVPFGKSDTLELDSTPENTIKKMLTEFFDKRLVLITEEAGKSADLVGTYNEVVCFSDPMDGSKVLADFLNSDVDDKSIRLKDVFNDPKYQQAWAQKHRDPASINGCSGSVTAVKEGNVLFNVLVNYITQEIFVACQEGIRYQKIAQLLPSQEEWENLPFDKWMREWPEVKFPKPGPESQETFVTYLRKPVYQRNFMQTNLVSAVDEAQKDFAAPGPARVLYLSDLIDPPVGFILSNGEKIGEFLGYLAYARFAERGRDPILNVYELAFDSPETIDKVLLAPGEHYSLFETFKRDGQDLTRINIEKLRYFKNPSHYRGTILVVHKQNTLITGIAEGQNSRRITLSY